MNRILQCGKVPILAPRRFFHPKRVGKIDEIKEILRVKIHSFNEAVLNHKIAFFSFYWTVYLANKIGYKTYTRGDSIIWSIILDDKPPNLLLEPAEFAGVLIGSYIVSKVLFQPLAKWAGSSQKGIKQLRVGCVAMFVFALLSEFIGCDIFVRNALPTILQSSESLRMVHFYNSVKKKRDRKGKAYEIVLAQTWEAENYKDDFDQIWNLDYEIFNQIDVHGTEDIKTQIHKLQNTVKETTQDE